MSKVKKSVKKPTNTGSLFENGIILIRIADLQEHAKSSLSELVTALQISSHSSLMDLGVNIVIHSDRLQRLHKQVKSATDKLMKTLNTADSKIAKRVDLEAKRVDREVTKTLRQANRKSSLQAKMDKLTKQMEDL